MPEWSNGLARGASGLVPAQVQILSSANLSIEQAILKAKYVEYVENVLLDVESEKLIYSISGEKRGNLIAIIPVSAKVEQKVDATYGNIISTKKPWWSFLATKI